MFFSELIPNCQPIRSRVIQEELREVSVVHFTDPTAVGDSIEVLDAVRADCIDGGFEVLDKPFAVEGLAVS